MKRGLLFPLALAACVQAPPPEPSPDIARVSKSQFQHDGGNWVATIEGDRDTLADVEVTGGGGPTAPVKEFALQGCAQAGGTFDPAAAVTFEDPGLYRFTKACQL